MFAGKSEATKSGSTGAASAVVVDCSPLVANATLTPEKKKTVREKKK